MSDEIDRKAAELISSLPALRSQLRFLGEEQAAKQINTQHDLALKTDEAINSTDVLTKLLDGEFKPTSPPAGLRDAVKSLDSNWKAAEVAAERCLEGASRYSVLITQFHDSGLGDWMTKSKNLEGILSAALASTNESLRIQQDAVQSANENAAGTRAALETMQNKLNEQRHKYDDADKYTWIWPPARLILEALKPIIEALSHDVENAERAYRTAQETAMRSVQNLQEQQYKAQRLSELSQHYASVKQQGEMLTKDCQSLMGEVERTQQELARIKTERYNAWQRAALCANRAEDANYSLTKEDYGTSILQLVEKAIADASLKPRLASIVDHLVQHDDAKGSIRNARTDEHPEGLLQYVQQQLQSSVPAGVSAMSWADGQSTLMIQELMSATVNAGVTMDHAEQAKMAGLVHLMRF